MHTSVGNPPQQTGFFSINGFGEAMALALYAEKAAMEKFYGLLSQRLPSADWLLKIGLETNVNSDLENYLGVDALLQTHLNDARYLSPRQYEAPTFKELSSLYFNKPQWDASYSRFSTDIRESIGEGQVYEFEAMHPTDKVTRAKLVFNWINELPTEYEARVVMPSGRTVDARLMKEIEYEVIGEKMVFRVVIGKKEFVEQTVARLLPKDFTLEQNYPNPFNPSTTIQYQLPSAAQVSLKIYDVLGREIATLVNTTQAAGRYNYQLSTVNYQLSSGVYFYRLSVNGATNGAQNFVQTKKMMLVK
jgi:hypothetical protein